MKDSVEELTKRRNNIKMPPFDNLDFEQIGILIMVFIQF